VLLSNGLGNRPADAVLRAAWRTSAGDNARAFAAHASVHILLCAKAHKYAAAQVFAAQENNNRGRRRTHRRTKGYQRVSTADSSNDDEYDGGNNEAAVPAS
jgi:hypothetical protein